MSWGRRADFRTGLEKNLGLIYDHMKLTGNRSEACQVFEQTLLLRNHKLVFIKWLSRTGRKWVLKGVQLLMTYSAISTPYVNMGKMDRNILQEGRAPGPWEQGTRKFCAEDQPRVDQGILLMGVGIFPVAPQQDSSIAVLRARLWERLLWLSCPLLYTGWADGVQVTCLLVWQVLDLEDPYMDLKGRSEHLLGILDFEIDATTGWNFGFSPLRSMGICF